MALWQRARGKRMECRDDWFKNLYRRDAMLRVSAEKIKTVTCLKFTDVM